MRRIVEAQFANNSRSDSPSTEAKRSLSNNQSHNSNNNNNSQIVHISKAAQGLGSRKFELQCELQSLQKKEKELLEALGSTNNALQELGVPSFLIHDGQEQLKNMNRLKASGLM